MSISKFPALLSTLTPQKERNKFRKKWKKVRIFTPMLLCFLNIIVDKRRSSQMIDPIEEEEEDQEVQEKRRRVNIKILF